MKKKNRTIKLSTGDDGLVYKELGQNPFSGCYTDYHKNGNIKITIHFENGKKHGLEKQYYDSGTTDLEINYKNGMEDGLCTYYYKNGQEQDSGMYKNGKKEGVWTEWYENGKKLAKINHKNGLKNGTFVMWNENGEQTHKGICENDNFVKDNDISYNYFDNVTTSYVDIFLEKQEKLIQKMPCFKAENPAKELNKSYKYPADTLIIDDGDVSYLVLKANGGVIKLSPFYTHWLYKGSIAEKIDYPITVSLSPVLETLRCLPGVEEFDYPDSANINNIFINRFGENSIFNSIFKMEPVVTLIESIDLDERQYFLLGRELSISYFQLRKALKAINHELSEDNATLIMKRGAERVIKIIKHISTIHNQDKDDSEIIDEDLFALKPKRSKGANQSKESKKPKDNVSTLMTESINKWRNQKQQDNNLSSLQEKLKNISSPDKKRQSNTQSASEANSELPPLWLALAKKDKVKFTELINEGEDINKKVPFGGWPYFLILHYAAEQHDIEFVRLIINSGADINASLFNGETALAWALKGEKIENFNLLLEAGANPDPDLLPGDGYDMDKHGHGYSPLSMAAKRGLTYAVVELIKLGVNVNKVNNFGETALKLAINERHIECAKTLLSAGANPDISDNEGFSPIHNAVGNGDYDMVNILVNFGANVNLLINPKEEFDTSDKGWTPLMYACLSSPIKDEIIQLLVDSDADVNLSGISDNGGVATTPLVKLLESAMLGNDPANAFSILVKNGVEINSKSITLEGKRVGNLLLVLFTIINNADIPLTIFEVVLPIIKKDLKKYLVLIVEGKEDLPITVEQLLENVKSQDKRNELGKIFVKNGVSLDRDKLLKIV